MHSCVVVAVSTYGCRSQIRYSISPRIHLESARVNIFSKNVNVGADRTGNGFICTIPSAADCDRAGRVHYYKIRATRIVIRMSKSKDGLRAISKLGSMI